MMVGVRGRGLDLEARELVWPCPSTDHLEGLGDKSLCLRMSHFCQLRGL